MANGNGNVRALPPGRIGRIQPRAVPSTVVEIPQPEPEPGNGAEQEIHSKVTSTNTSSAMGLFFPGGETVLDLGCGEGYLAEKLCAAGIKVVLFYQTAEALAAAQGRCPKALGMRGNPLYADLPSADNVLAVGPYMAGLDYEQVDALMRKFPGKRLVTTIPYLGDDDSGFNLWFYGALNKAGYRVKFEFISYTGTPELLILAERN